MKKLANNDFHPTTSNSDGLYSTANGNGKHGNSNGNSNTSSIDDLHKNKHSRQQRMVILAGPHKTGTSSIQLNLYQWSKLTVNFTQFPSTLQPNPDPLIPWIWPIPTKIAEYEYNNTMYWKPSKGFYSLIDALSNQNAHPSKREVFQEYTPQEIIGMYKDAIGTYWKQGNDIVWGSEAMDMIVKVPEGRSILHKISKEILPADIQGEQVTVVVVRRTPKIKHLISIWHQNCNRKTDPKFYEWMTTTKNTFGPIDSLGMVDMLLEETDWNIVLVNMRGVIDDLWDISYFVSCKILGEECENRIPKVMNNDGKGGALRMNVRSGQRAPNVPNKTLDELDALLYRYDCNYRHVLKNNDRLKIYYSDYLQVKIDKCDALGSSNDTQNDNNHDYPRSRIELKKQITDIVLKHGKLD